jgi:hypothetical protein
MRLCNSFFPFFSVFYINYLLLGHALKVFIFIYVTSAFYFEVMLFQLFSRVLAYCKTISCAKSDGLFVWLMSDGWC